jgi:hypothetical protein
VTSEEVPEGVAVLTLGPGGKNGVSTDMTVAYWGESMGESADIWARRASQFILSLDSSHNGAQLSVPKE